MSTNRGRSWRPDQKNVKKDSRKVLIYLTATVLTGLIAAVLFLIAGSGVPLLHLLVLTERDFHSDETAVTPLPPGSTRSNAVDLAELFERCREANRARIGESANFESVADFVNADLQFHGDRLLMYCATEAWCVPEKEHPEEECVLELLPARLSPQQPPVRFSKFLSSLKDVNFSQIVLLLEFTGRNPGLASGAITDDIPLLIRREIKRAKVPGLTIICSHGQDERSWEYVSESTEMPSAEPLFQGTAFGHFLQQALTEGQAGTAAELHKTLQENVSEWADRHFGEPQTVWMVSTNEADAEKELLTVGRLPKKKHSVEDTTQSDANESKESPESKTDDNSKSAKSASDSPEEDRPAVQLQGLLAQRDALRDQTVTPVLYPVEWLQLHTNLVAAERFAINGNDHEFKSRHDDVLTTLKSLERKAVEFSQSPEQQDIEEWIGLGPSFNLSEGDARLLKRTQIDFSVELNNAPSRLPDEIVEHRGLRQAFASMLDTDLKDLSRSIADETPDAQARLIHERLALLQNLSSHWSGNIVPEQWTTIREVLRGEDTKWLVTAMKPLVRLLDLRREALQLAAGRDSTGRFLRTNDWRSISRDINELLRTLHSAERWLCVGAEGMALAEDRLDVAERSLSLLREQLAVSSRLKRIQDAQRFRIPFLIEYLALRLEETSLADKEIASAKEMAVKAVAGTVTAADFPVGQLNQLEFTREIIEAMFALTRDFSKPQAEVNEADEKHVAVLERYVNDRLGGSMSASDTWQLLNIPLISDRERLYQSFLQPRAGIRRNPAESADKSGIWTSFWSLRLADAVAQKSQTGDWQKWSDLLAGIGDADRKSNIVTQRAAMASLLRNRWMEAIQGLGQFQNSEVFVPEKELIQLLAADLTRRLSTTSTNNRSLYSRIQQTLSDRPLSTHETSLTILNPNAELTTDYRVTTHLKVSNAAALYVLNEDVTLTNTGIQADRNWFRVPLDTTSEADVALEISLLKAPLAPTPLLIVAVDAEGAAVNQVITTLQPPAENSWEISISQIEEGNPEERPITLEEIDGRTNRRLRLLPSTLDPETQMDVPTQLRLRLHRTKGISKSVRLRALLADGKTEAWKLPDPVLFSGNEDLVEIPFSQQSLPPVEAATGTAAIPDISRGLIFEMTPDDLPRKITSQFRITPRLLGPEEIVKRPVPKYETNDELVISLNRVPFDSATVVWPKKLGAEVELSPKLQRYLLPGTSLRTPDADGVTFRIPFHSDIRKVLSEQGLEFGISVGGIPHGWWWTLKDGTARLLEGRRPQIRTFVSVDNPTEAKPVPDAQNLLLGEGWEKAKLTARVFIHGGSFDRDWSMRMFFLRQNAEASIRADAPFDVKGRYRETVTVAAGKNGTWQFSTTTQPYSIPAFSAEKYQLQNGHYSLNAVLEPRESNDDPITSDVQFTLDSTGPILDADSVQLNQQKTNINDLLRGQVRVTDAESGVIEVRVGLNPELMVPQAITPGNEVNVDFKLDSTKGFPKLTQSENDEEATVTLYAEAKNGAGTKTTTKKSVTFILPGKAKPMAKAPGTILVKLKGGSPFNITVSGNGIEKNANNTIGSAAFPALPPGIYTVTWKPVQGTAGNGEVRVSLASGKTEIVGPGK